MRPRLFILHTSPFILFFTAPARTRTQNPTFEASCDVQFHHKGAVADGPRALPAATGLGAPVKTKNPGACGAPGSFRRGNSTETSPGARATVVAAQGAAADAGQRRERPR